MGVESAPRSRSRDGWAFTLFLFPVLFLATSGCAGRSDEAGGMRFQNSGQALGDGDTNCVSLGDIDQDGDVDALAANTGSPSRAWLNDGAGVFTDSGQILPSGSCVSLSDLDGDGDLDAFFTGEAGRVLLNEGSGWFRASGPSYGGPGGAGMAVGDLDGDGDDDVVVARWGHPEGLSNEIWVNAGDGTFLSGEAPESVRVSGNASLADLDLDGDLDLLMANQADFIHNPIPDELWLNDGFGRFLGAPSLLGDACTYEIATGDFDDDGDVDLFVANSSHAGKSDPANRVFLNDGHGHLRDSDQALGDTYSLSVAVGDGDLDAFVANAIWQGAHGANRVWINLTRNGGR